MEARYIVEENGKRKGVLLPVERYERLIEEFDDLRAVEEAP